ncbi:MAG: hypothetical protein ACOC1J_02175 [Prolixibacteraceae bacterium]
MTQNKDTVDNMMFLKKENISGIVFSAQPERDALLTDFSVEREELFTGAAKYRLGTRSWQMTGFRQEVYNLFFETGIFGGAGNLLDSTKVGEIKADHKVIGLRANATADYSSRFYYDTRNYSLVEVNAWGRYGVYRQTSEGTVTDSAGVQSVYENTENLDKLRYGFQAKAAWGYGKLNVLNHYMVAEYLLNKHYSRRVFSDEETLKLAQQIAKIKHNRNVKTNLLSDKEVQQLKDFLRNQMMLKAPENMENDWQLGEFFPRYNGNRLEFGPFFRYYNREPDFVYGAFIQFDHSKYIDVKKNRNFSIALKYNRYKIRSWLVMETDLNWSFYRDLKSRFTAGMKYVPGIIVKNIDDFGPLRNGFVPYLEYFTQLSSTVRVNAAISWQMTDDERFMQNGPLFSLVLYRSRY